MSEGYFDPGPVSGALKTVRIGLSSVSTLTAIYAFATTASMTGLKGAFAAILTGTGTAVYAGLGGLAGAFAGAAGGAAIAALANATTNRKTMQEYVNTRVKNQSYAWKKGSETDQNALNQVQEKAWKDAKNYSKSKRAERTIGGAALGIALGAAIGAAWTMPYGYDESKDMILNGMLSNTPEPQVIFSPANDNAAIPQHVNLTALSGHPQPRIKNI